VPSFLNITPYCKIYSNYLILFVVRSVILSELYIQVLTCHSQVIKLSNQFNVIIVNSLPELYIQLNITYCIAYTIPRCVIVAYALAYALSITYIMRMYLQLIILHCIYVYTILPELYIQLMSNHIKLIELHLQLSGNALSNHNNVISVNAN
jgi:hypothetical protein